MRKPAMDADDPGSLALEAAESDDDGSPTAPECSKNNQLTGGDAVGRRNADTAASQPAVTRQGKQGMYRRKVAPGALALKEAAQARYLADMRAHFDEVKHSLLLVHFSELSMSQSAGPQGLMIGNDMHAPELMPRCTV